MIKRTGHVCYYYDGEGAERHLDDTSKTVGLFEGCASLPSLSLSGISLGVAGRQGGFDGVVASEIEANRDARGKEQTERHFFRATLDSEPFSRFTLFLT